MSRKTVLVIYQNAVVIIGRADLLFPPHPGILAFKAFLRQEWQTSLGLIETARQLAARR